LAKPRVPQDFYTEGELIMGKKAILAVILVFVAWELMDFLIHGVILASAYETTAELWRPREEMNMVLMAFVVLVSAFVFVLIFDRFFAQKKMATALQYGFWFGVGAGVPMAYGTYSVMPLPYYMALTWFLGTLVEAVVGGVIVGLVVKESS
jgi:hypothetical protein